MNRNRNTKEWVGGGGNTTTSTTYSKERLGLENFLVTLGLGGGGGEEMERWKGGRI